MFVLHRQVALLSVEEGEARMLGVNVGTLRLVVLLVATLLVSSVVNLTGLISFVGLLRPTEDPYQLMDADTPETLELLRSL